MGESEGECECVLGGKCVCVIAGMIVGVLGGEGEHV